MGHWVSCHPECHWPPISGYKLLPLYFQLLAAGMAWGCTRSEEWNFYLPVHSNKNIFSKRVQEPDKAARCENQLVHVQPYKIEDTSTPRMSTGTRTISQDPFLLCCYMQIKNSPQIKMDTQQRHGQLAAGLVKTQTPCPSHQGHKHYTLETLRIRPFHNSWKDYEHYLLENLVHNFFFYQTDNTTDRHQKRNCAQVHSYPDLTALMIISGVPIPLEKNQRLFVSTCKIYYFLNITAQYILLNPLKHEHDAKLTSLQIAHNIERWMTTLLIKTRRKNRAGN